jgi:hypothetical protein
MWHFNITLVANDGSHLQKLPKELWKDISNELSHMGESDAIAMGRQLVNRHVGDDTTHLPWQIVDVMHKFQTKWGGQGGRLTLLDGKNWRESYVLPCKSALTQANWFRA